MKMIFSTFFTTLLTLVIFSTSVYAATPVVLDGQPVDVTPVIVDGRTLISARDVVELLGGDVGWNAELEQVTILHDGIEVLLAINNPIAYVDGEAVELDIPPQIIDGSTKIPLRFVAEAFGVDVNFRYGAIFISTGVEYVQTFVPTPAPTPTPAPAPIPTPAPTPEPTPAPAAGGDLQRTVFLPATRNGIYHRINNCGRMNPARASSMTREQARNRGYRACQRCW